MSNLFEKEEHECRFYTIMDKDSTSELDKERISMFYIISGNTELYSHLHEIYDCRTHCLKRNTLHKLEYICSSSQKLLMLALHLYNNRNCKNITLFEILNNLDRYNLDLALNALHLRFS